MDQRIGLDTFAHAHTSAYRFLLVSPAPCSVVEPFPASHPAMSKFRNWAAAPLDPESGPFFCISSTSSFISGSTAGCRSVQITIVRRHGSVIRTIVHDVRHSEDERHAHQRHQYHAAAKSVSNRNSSPAIVYCSFLRALHEVYDVEPSPILIEILLTAGLDLYFQLAIARAVERPLVAPLVAPEGLPCLHSLLLRPVCGFRNIDPQRWEEVVSTVYREEIARFCKVREGEGIVSSYGRFILYSRRAYEYRMCRRCQRRWVGQEWR